MEQKPWISTETYQSILNEFILKQELEKAILHKFFNLSSPFITSVQDCEISLPYKRSQKKFNRNQKLKLRSQQTIDFRILSTADNWQLFNNGFM